MKKPILSQKLFNYSLLCGLLCAVFLSLSHFNAACDDLRANVLRLHIIANSDSPTDQALKLKIRDGLLEQSREIFAEADDIDSAVIAAKASLGKIEEVANKVIADNNFGYTAKAKVVDSYFETREYEDFTLPAGTYKSLVITVGEGKGKNWWCVIFPEICLPCATDAKLNDSVSDEAAKTATNKSKYVLKFKAVEIYEKLKKSLFKE